MDYKKNITHFFTLLFSLLFIINTSSAQQAIEGLSYIDGKPISVIVKDGKILSIQNIDKLKDEGSKVYIAPGLVDNQVNGFNGVSFSFGGGDLTLEGVKKATQGLWERGVTTYLPTLTTNDFEVLLKNFLILAEAKNDDAFLGSIPGFHLEGPYISPIDGYRGAHPQKHVKKPDWGQFMELYKASGNNILTITVAPELDGAMDFIRKCDDLGIVVALGHHNGSAQQINEAVINGAKTCTHLGNGCANSINRHDNPLWPQLSNDDLMISIICDGFHLRREEIRVFIKAKGIEKTIITSDVTKYANLKPGIFKNSIGDDIELTEDGIVQYPAQKVLAGSASAINRGVVHVMNVTSCSLEDAIQMASSNPAKLYGLTDRGKITPGMRADLILFKIGPNEIEIQKTYVAGTLVFHANQK